jgi:two-component system response regulator VanR
MKILIIDDNQFARDGIKQYIELCNIDVEIYEADTGAHAREIFDKNKFDLILLDISLPDVNGEDVLSFLRQKDSKVDVIITSVITSDFEIERLKKLGISTYLPKPVDMDRLIGWINRIRQQ